VKFSITSLPDGWTGSAPGSLMGWTANNGTMSITIPAGTPLGAYDIELQATNQGRTRTLTVPIQVVRTTRRHPRPPPCRSRAWRSVRRSCRADRLERGDRSDEPDRRLPGRDEREGGAFGATVDLAASRFDTTRTISYEVPYRFRVRAIDAAGNWSPWATGPVVLMHAVDDRSSSLVRHGSWGTLGSDGSCADPHELEDYGNSVSLTFTGVRSRSSRQGPTPWLGPDPHRRQVGRHGEPEGRSRHGRSSRSTTCSRPPARTRSPVKVNGTGTYRDVLVDAFVISR
jgi:hypothetical protein